MKKLLFLALILLSQRAISQIIADAQSGFTTNLDITSIESKKSSNVPDIQSIRSKPSHQSQIYIDFVGSGDIQKSVSEGKEIKANTGIGIIFERYNDTLKVFQSIEIEGIINIATTSDTIQSIFQNDILMNRRSFGNYVLNPVSAKQSLFINSNIYFGYPLSKKEDKEGKESTFAKISKYVSGVNIRVVASNSLWQYNDIPINLGAIAARAGIFHEFIPDNYRLSEKELRSKFSLFLGIGLSVRGIIGDITSSENKTLRESFLGSDQTFFAGPEPFFGFRLNNLRAEFQMPILKKKENSVYGLTNTQFLFSIKFVGGFPLKISSNKTPDND